MEDETALLYTERGRPARRAKQITGAASATSNSAPVTPARAKPNGVANPKKNKTFEGKTDRKNNTKKRKVTKANGKRKHKIRASSSSSSGSSSDSDSDSDSDSSEDSIGSSSSDSSSSSESAPKKKNLYPTSSRKGQRPGGYTRILKNQYVGRSMRKLPEDDAPFCACRPSNACSDDTCINRTMMIECSPGHCPVADRCGNMRFQKREYAPIVPFKAGDKGWGIRAGALIRKGTFIIEYVGEVIDQAELEQRTEKNKNTRHFYFLTIDANECIDASKKGNLARFINHSCSPNCETQKWQVGGETCVGIFAKRDIVQGEELTFDYQFERFGSKKQRCLCGSKNCCEWIGGRIKRLEDDERVEGLNEPKSKPRVLNHDFAVIDLLENQDISGSSYKWEANMEPIFTDEAVERALERRRRREEEDEIRRKKLIELAIQKKLARKRKKPANEAAASAAANGSNGGSKATQPSSSEKPKSSTKKPQKLQAASSSSSSSSDSESDSDSDDPVNGIHKYVGARAPVFLRRNAEKVHRSLLARYQHYVFESAAQQLEQERTAELRREKEARERRTAKAFWLYAINPERLAREGQVIFDGSDGNSPPVRNGLSSSGGSSRSQSLTASKA